MSSVRLYVLRTLAELGPMLGHQIRSEAQTNRTELWTDEAGLHEAVRRADGHVKARPQRDQTSATPTGCPRPCQREPRGCHAAKSEHNTW